MTDKSYGNQRSNARPLIVAYHGHDLYNKISVLILAVLCSKTHEADQAGDRRPSSSLKEL